MQFSSATQKGLSLSVFIIIGLVVYYVKFAPTSPRTRTLGPMGQPRSESFWMPLHERLVDEAVHGQGENGHFDVILYGDSIIESWRGTQAGHSVQWAEGNAAAFSQFQSTFHVGAFGIAGDQTQHLLWRLQNGELSSNHPPRLAVVLIGTNNLGGAMHQVNESTNHPAGGVAQALMEAVPGMIGNVESIIKLFHKVAPRTHVLLLGILPRASPESSFTLPGTFSEAIASANAEFKRFAMVDDRVHYVDCGDYFVDTGSDGVARLSQSKMPDGLHPNGRGAEALVVCIQPAMSAILHLIS